MDPSPGTAPPAVDTWSALLLRNPRGEFLSSAAGYRVWPTPTPLQAYSFANLYELEVWLEGRSTLLRTTLEAEGYLPVRLTLSVDGVPLSWPIDTPETRPIVAEAVVE